jgi:hypothetical protein
MRPRTGRAGKSGQGAEINFKASQRRARYPLMRFSWPDDPAAVAEQAP